MNRLLVCALAFAGAAAIPSHTVAQDKTSSKAIYDSSCAACHGTGLLGAPKFGDTAQWAPRAKGGIDALVASATAGTPRGMPPRGGRADLSPAQLKGVIEYMMGAAAPKPVEVAAVKAPVAKAAAKPSVVAAPAESVAKSATGSGGAVVAAPTPAPAPAQAPTATPALAPAPVSASAPTPPVPAPAAAAIAAARAAAPNSPATAEVNAFNRLLKPLARFNRPALESGIHDPGNDMTLQLQAPAVAFAEFPKSMAGNHVDWVKSLDGKVISPRWDRLDPAAQAVVMDLNIVREVKGSMPDVVYPHKQHTEWLDCSNCHPSIFVPQKGANQISMASILLGQKCGVCHGKVAFPVSECRLCHSKKKAETTAAAERKP